MARDGAFRRSDKLKCTCTYHQASHTMECTNDGTGEPVINSSNGIYSGNGLGLNTPAMQGAHDEGPIPQGIYNIGTSRTNSPGGARTGVLTFPLIPTPGTNTFGRSGLLIHGDNPSLNHSASKGCIILPFPDRKKLNGCRGGTLDVVP